MAKKKTNKIEENYKAFSKMSPEKLDARKVSLEDELKEIETRIANKEKELEGRQATIDLTTDADKKDVLTAQKETAEQEKADLIVMKEKKEKEIKAIENYDNNKGKIEKVIGYKDRLSRKLKDNKIKLKEFKSDLKGKKAEEKEIDKKLKKPEELTNDEYNDLMKQKETVRREIEAKEKAIQEAEKRIEALTGSVSKCDLVWKNLMLGKSWDDIHVKAVRMNATRVAAKDDTEPSKDSDIDMSGFDKVLADDEPKAAYVSLIDKMKREAKQDNAMTEYDEFAQKHPRLAKIRDFFRKFRNNKKAETETEKLVESTAEAGNEKESEGNQRDAFIEQLRQMTDAEYKKEARQAKEAEYIEMHKAKPNEDQQKDEDDSQR